MSDVNGPVAALQGNVNSPASLSASPGAMLRHAREAAGVSAETLAAAMKVSVAKIEGMEADDYSALPDVVFASALAASICRVFGVDAVPVLALMPKGGERSLAGAAADINATIKNGSERLRRNSLLSQATRPLGVAVVVLLLGAAVFVFLPYRNDAPESAGSENTVYEPGVRDVPLELTVPVENLSGSAAPQVQESALTMQQQTAAKQALVEQAELEKAEKAAVLASTDSVLEFSARAPSWVQVRDASKKVVFERTLAKGDVVSATGAPPLKVVVGRAEAVDIKVRGTAFDLAEIAKSGVARFEVQ